MVAVLGLSPRVRGNQFIDRCEEINGGSIPACAGEPSSRPQSAGLPRVYPRVCGGTIGAAYDPYESPGLSPRVRGNRDRVGPNRGPAGSIPACAGEPGPGSRLPSQQPVYPRVCGGTCAMSDTRPR